MLTEYQIKEKLLNEYGTKFLVNMNKEKLMEFFVL